MRDEDFPPTWMDGKSLGRIAFYFLLFFLAAGCLMGEMFKHGYLEPERLNDCAGEACQAG